MQALDVREAMLYERLPGGRVRCNVCRWRCVIRPGSYGVCRVRRNDGGILNILNYGLVSAANVDPIEKKPLAHFFPGASVFSVGSLGCNFHCKHCQNWEISFATPAEDSPYKATYLPPESAVALAKRYGCAGIAWTYNDPSVWLEYTINCARLAKKEGMYTVYVTNGFSTPEALDAIGPYLDAFRVDLKGFSDVFYRDLAKVPPRWRGILDVTVRAKEKWGMHVEVVTNVIPTMNDDEEQLRGIARWIRDALGALTPWHLTAFHPDHMLMHLPPTPITTLERGCEIGWEEGLKFCYVGNVPGHPYENTRCYQCRELVVQRQGYITRVIGLAGSCCRFCGADLNMRVGITPVGEATARMPAAR